MKIEMKRFFTNPFLYTAIIWACCIGFYIYQYKAVKPRNKKVYTIYEKIQEKQDSILSSYDFNKGVLMLTLELGKRDDIDYDEFSKIQKVADSLENIEINKRVRLNVDMELLYKEIDKL